MNVKLVKVKEEQKSILAHLIELYEYDFSDFEDSDVNAYGLYGYSYLDYYWTEAGRYAYFIQVDGKLAGFAMVCGYCYVSKKPDTHSMAEFFVMKKYRHRGIGKQAALEVLNSHPGSWELMVHPNNPVSHVFWENVIRQAASGEIKTVENVEGVYENGLGTAYLFQV